MSFLNKKTSKTCRVGQMKGDKRVRSAVVVLGAEDDVRQLDGERAHDENRHRLHRAEQASGHKDTGGERPELPEKATPLADHNYTRRMHYDHTYTKSKLETNDENQSCCPNDGTVHDLAIFGLSVKLASHETELKSLQTQLSELEDHCSRRNRVVFLPRRYCTPSVSEAVSKYNKLRLLILETAKPLYQNNCIHLPKMEMLLEKCEKLDPDASALQRLAISLDRYAMRQLSAPSPVATA